MLLLYGVCAVSMQQRDSILASKLHRSSSSNYSLGFAHSLLVVAREKSRSIVIAICGLAMRTLISIWRFRSKVLCTHVKPLHIYIRMISIGEHSFGLYQVRS